MPKQIPQETIERIRDLYAQGWALNAIEEEVCVSRPTITRYTADLPQRARQRKSSTVRLLRKDSVTESEKARMIELRREGYMVADIAALMGRAQATVTRYTQDIRESLTANDIACIRYLRREGFAYSAIATEYRCSVRVVRMYVADVTVKPSLPPQPRKQREAVAHTGPFVLELPCLFCYRSITLTLKGSALSERADKVCRRYVGCKCGQVYRVRDLISVDELLFRWQEWRGEHQRVPDMTVKSVFVGTV